MGGAPGRWDYKTYISVSSGHRAVSVAQQVREQQDNKDDGQISSCQEFREVGVGQGEMQLNR